MSKAKTGAPEDSGTYWFTVFTWALQSSDFIRAAEAQSNLRRLGIDVRLAVPSTQNTGGATC